MKEAKLQQKQAVIEEIKARLQESQSAVIVEYRGLDVASVTELRNQFREAGVEYKVYKNTMVSLALQSLGYEGYEEYLTGPNAFVFSTQDMVSGPKIAQKFADSHAQLIIKAGMMDGQMMDAEGVKKLSKMPSKEVLLSMVLRGLQGPISGLANVCQGTIRSAVYALNAIKEKKEGEAA
ncbi:MAG: 50S ribosomal protein L10 [Ndongobacter sp.]|nr:50S ribosomal protein L10 [Ndongobacter sp.]